ncbi:MAG TPA: PAS domain S-box protein, partial [Gemmatimonadales bacterium]|nr:PAS domain S-box protein [Gemmatimonadales bacterium]
VGAERMLGYAAADVMNKITPAEISDPEEVVARAKALSLEFGTTITPGFEALVFKASRGIEDIYELTYIRKDGSRFPAIVSVTALRDAEDAIIGYLLIGTDNTARNQVEEERKKLDQRLRDQHFYTRSLIESNIDALMTTDPRGIITDVNKQMESLTGCTRDELIGAPFKNYFTDADRAEAAIKRVLSEGTVSNYELTARARDGTLTLVSYNASTFHDRERVLQGVFAAARDMTELKLIEQALQQKNLELEAASRMKSEFLANMSHELRTPLNAIIGFSDLMLEGGGGGISAQQREFLDAVLRNGRHLLTLINSVLDLSKIEAGRMSLVLASTDLREAITGAVSDTASLRAAKRQECILRLESGSLMVVADGLRVRQVLFNLLSNASKFTPDGGEIVLTAVRTQAPLPLPAERTGDERRVTSQDVVWISVADSGIGIATEDMPKLFQEFSQVESSASRHAQGTGLGLALSKKFVEMHGGTIGAESVLTRGSTFWFILPVTGPMRRNSVGEAA